MIAGRFLACLLLAVCTAATSPAAEPTLAEMLEQKVDFAAKNESLENCVNALLANVKRQQPKFKPAHFTVTFMGDDLKAEGITRNKAIRDLDSKDQSFAEVLTALMLLADPNRTATDPSDSKLTLVWTIGADPKDPEQECILITTRAGAKKRGDTLPKAFQAK